MLDSRSRALEIATLLAEHRAEDVVILDLKEVAGWTDYFVIGTCTSSTHLGGLLRFVEEYVGQNNLTPLNHPVAKDDQSWALDDLGDIVIHIMNKDARAFYELEKLWFKAPCIKVQAGVKA